MRSPLARIAGRRLPGRAAAHGQRLLSARAAEPRRRALLRRADRADERDARDDERRQRRGVRRHVPRQRRSRRLHAAADALVRGPRPDRARLSRCTPTRSARRAWALGAEGARRAATRAAALSTRPHADHGRRSSAGRRASPTSSTAPRGVALVVRRALAGRRVGGVCRKPTRANRRLADLPALRHGRAHERRRPGRARTRSPSARRRYGRRAALYRLSATPSEGERKGAARTIHFRVKR